MGFGTDGRGAIITQTDLITLLTLADATALKQDNPLTLVEDFRMIKAEIRATLNNISAENDLPVDLYLVNNELTVAEIAEAITAGGPLNRNDRAREERAERAVFLLGTFTGTQTTSINAEIPLMGPKGQQGIIEKTVRWTFSNPEGWSIVAVNQSGGALATGAVVRLAMKFFGVWLA